MSIWEDLKVEAAHFQTHGSAGSSATKKAVRHFLFDIQKRRSKQISDNVQIRKGAFERCYCIESQIPPGTLRNVNNTLRRKLSGARLP